MNNKNLIISTIVVVLAFVSITTTMSCTHASQVQTVSFSKDILPILTADCAINSSCHVGDNGLNQDVNFDADSAYLTIQSKRLVNTTTPAASLLYAELEEGLMPLAPYPKLSAGQKQLFLTWIQQGAKNN
jgi:hypothetical protein